MDSDSWEEHAIRRPHLPDRVTSTRSARATAFRTSRTRLPVEARVEFVDRLTRRGTSGHRGRFLRLAPRGAAARRHGRRSSGASARPPAVALPGARAEREGSRPRARRRGVREVAVFTAASETFNRHNINAGVDESIERFRPVVARAQEEKIRVRAYVSTAFGCPYEGDVSPEAVREVVHKLLDLGGRRDLHRRHDRRRDARRRVRGRRGASTTRASRAASWRSTSTTRAARRSPTSSRGSSAGSRPSTPPPAASEAAPTRPARRATWRPRTCSTCSRVSGSRRASRCRSVVEASRDLSPAGSASGPRAATSPRSGARS